MSKLSKNYPVMQVLGYDKLEKYSSQIIQKKSKKMPMSFYPGTRKTSINGRDKQKLNINPNAFKQRSTTTTTYNIPYRDSKLETASKSMGVRQSSAITGPTQPQTAPVSGLNRNSALTKY